MGKHIIERTFDADDAAKALSTRFKNIILSYMTAKKIRVTDLAMRMGVSQANVSLLLTKDGNWNLKTIARMCDALDIEMEIRVKRRKKCRYI